MASSGTENDSPAAQARTRWGGSGYDPVKSESGSSKGIVPATTAPAKVVVKGRQEQRDMEAPALATPSERPGEDEMTTVRLVRPVVAAGPLGEHDGERRGRPGMGRMYKRVNDFPIRKGCRPPRD